MKVKITYIILRFIVGLLLIMNVIGLFIKHDDSQQSRLIFNTLQSLGFLIVSLIPYLLKKTIKIEIPNFMTIIFIIFCLCHFILGEIIDFYIKFIWWDSMLHTLSGSMLAIVAYSIVNMANQDNERLHLSPIFVSFFAICFTVTTGVFWEIFEFSIDSLTKTNMQRYLKSDTLVPLVGREALLDTMKDLILDTLGATLIAVIGYISLKTKKTAFSRWTFKKTININEKLIIE